MNQNSFAIITTRRRKSVINMIIPIYYTGLPRLWNLPLLNSILFTMHCGICLMICSAVLNWNILQVKNTAGLRHVGNNLGWSYWWLIFFFWLWWLRMHFDSFCAVLDMTLRLLWTLAWSHRPINWPITTWHSNWN